MTTQPGDTATQPDDDASPGNPGNLTSDKHPAAVRRRSQGKNRITFNERVTVHSVPGHDPSRLSYVPEDLYNYQSNQQRSDNCCLIS